MSDNGEFSAHLRARTLEAFGLKPHDIGVAPVPWHVRLWRAATFAYRRGKAIDWRSYNAAEAEARTRQEDSGEDQVAAAAGKFSPWPPPAPGDTDRER